jgi:cysteine rich repeat protein
MTTSSKAKATAIVLLLGLSAWTEPAFAQQPSQAQVNAIRSACSGDFQAHCAGVQPGGSAALACLKKNVAALSPACQKAVAAVGGASAPTEKASEAPAVQSTAATPAATAPSTPAATAAPPAPQSVPPARAAAAPPPQLMPRAAAPVSIPPAAELALLRRACGPDYEANCSGVRPGGGRAVACLAANQDALSPRCQRALSAARQGM